MPRAEEHALSYLTPLLDAAADLASRFWNIHDGFLHDTRERKDVDGTSYGIDSTCYLIGRYLAYRELTRRELLRIHPDDYRREQQLTDRLDVVTDCFASDRRITEPACCLFRVHQQAIGEIMLEPMRVGGVSRTRCMGYSKFTERLLDPQFGRWFTSLRADLCALSSEPQRDSRLCRLQSALIDLVDELDPFENRVRRVGWTRCWEGSPVAVGVPVG